MSTHTPGPWKIDRHLGMLVGPCGEPITGEANYTLCSAAPDLLMALQGCLHFDDAFISDSKLGDALKQWRRAAKDAVSKALGGPPCP
jgi:hypothetical protein